MLSFAAMAASKVGRHSGGNWPPMGAIPINRSVGANGSASSTVATTGMPAPTSLAPSAVGTSCPAWVLSITATVASGLKRNTPMAVLAS